MDDHQFHSEQLTLEQLAEKLDKLRPQPLVGFVRFSDAEMPIYVDSKATPLPSLPELPRFLYEAALYLPGKTSVSIRQCNDLWQWNQVDWATPPPQDSTPECDDFLVYTQFAIGGKKLRFYTQFLPTGNVPGTKYPALQPAWNAFIGFEG